MADIRFRIVVNGKPLCTAGTEGLGSLSAILDWIKRDPAGYESSMKDRSTDARPGLESWSEESMGISTCGSNTAHAFINWPYGELQVGDEVTIEILGAGESDAPESIRRR